MLLFPDGIWDPEFCGNPCWILLESCKIWGPMVRSLGLFELEQNLWRIMKWHTSSQLHLHFSVVYDEHWHSCCLEYCRLLASSSSANASSHELPHKGYLNSLYYALSKGAFSISLKLYECWYSCQRLILANQPACFWGRWWIRNYPERDLRWTSMSLRDFCAETYSHWPSCETWRSSHESGGSRRHPLLSKHTYETRSITYEVAHFKYNNWLE